MRTASVVTDNEIACASESGRRHASENEAERNGIDAETRRERTDEEVDEETTVNAKRRSGDSEAVGTDRAGRVKRDTKGVHPGGVQRLGVYPWTCKQPLPLSCGCCSILMSKCSSQPEHHLSVNPFVDDQVCSTRNKGHCY